MDMAVVKGGGSLVWVDMVRSVGSRTGHPRQLVPMADIEGGDASVLMGVHLVDPILSSVMKKELEPMLVIRRISRVQ